MKPELIITTPCSGTNVEPIFSQTFSLELIELVDMLRVSPIGYNHVSKLLANQKLNHSFASLVNKKVIPLNIVIKDSSSYFQLSSCESLKPCLERDTIILIRSKRFGTWSFGFFRSRQIHTDIITPFDVQGILKGEKEVFFIEDRVDLNFFLIKFHYLSINDKIKLKKLFEQNLGNLRNEKIEEPDVDDEYNYEEDEDEVFDYGLDDDLPF